MVVGFTTIYAISAYHHSCFEFESRLGRGVQHYFSNVRFFFVNAYQMRKYIVMSDLFFDIMITPSG